MAGDAGAVHLGGTRCTVIHAEVLPDEQMACLRMLGPAAADLGFHLAGGTAVALTLGHRRSVDFDWFTPRFPGSAVDLAELLSVRGIPLDPTMLAGQTVHGLISGVRVIFLEFRPPLLEPLVAWPELGCHLASLADLAAMKLLAVTQRGTKKDFVDVLAISRQLPLAGMLECYRRRFGVTDTSRVLAGLCYFDDAEAEPMPMMLMPLEWDAVKHMLREMVRAVARP